MAFLRSYPLQDTFITNEYTSNGFSQATGSNFGAVPQLQVFARKNEFGSSVELGRALLKFDLSAFSQSMFVTQLMPTSSVQFVLKMYDEIHDDTLPSSYDLIAFPVSSAWDEGSGVDVDNFTDFGYANWFSATSIIGWNNSGSDYLTSSYGSSSQHFDQGNEDLEIDVTSIVQSWLTGGLQNNGFVVKLSDAYEYNNNSYYVKVFYARETKFVDKMPYLEARWNDVFKDNRGNFGYNSQNTLVMYNYARNALQNISSPIIVRLQDNLQNQSCSYVQEFTASQISTGIATCSFDIVNTASFSSSWYDIWYSGSYVYMTGNFQPLILTSSQSDVYPEYFVSCQNLKRTYRSFEQERIKVDVRKRNYFVHVVETGSLQVDRQYIESMYYSIVNDYTGECVVPFGTGSNSYTQLSYNGDGNYFNLSMQSFVPGFVYRILFLIYNNSVDQKVLDADILFKVVE